MTYALDEKTDIRFPINTINGINRSWSTFVRAKVSLFLFGMNVGDDSGVIIAQLFCRIRFTCVPHGWS